MKMRFEGPKWRSARRASGLLWIPILALVGASCSKEPEAPLPAPHRGPIVLITLDALRADVLGSFGGPGALTPHLDEVAREADWSGPAIAASSWTVPSMASVFTGLQPWLHGNWHGRATVLSDELLTLPEALKEQGFRTTAFRSNHWLKASFGYAQGFDSFGALKGGRRAEAHLSALAGDAEFVWIHILPPHAPYVYRENLVPRLPHPPGPLPEKIRPVDLEAYYDPEVALPEAEKKTAWDMYLLNVAWADALFGRLVQALKASGQWDRTLLAVTSDHGEEFGEHGQILHGGNLGRVLLEVPLMVKLPKEMDREILAPADSPIANHRLWATLVEAAGGPVPSKAAPSLFSEKEPEGALSELYQGNGVNTFSWVFADRQLLWESQFAPAEPEFFAAKAQELGVPPAEPLTEEPTAIFDRLARRWSAVPVLGSTAAVQPEISLWEWSEDGESRLLEKGPGAIPSARRFRAQWRALNGPDEAPGRTGRGRAAELSAEDKAALKALGYT